MSEQVVNSPQAKPDSADWLTKRLPGRIVAALITRMWRRVEGANHCGPLYELG